MPHTGGYTFSNYITGSSNKYAFVVAQTAADLPGMALNPVFLYGNSGLGKTHLLYAIRHRMLERDPDADVRICPADELVRSLVDAICAGREDGWDAEFSSADALLIDDTQTLAGKRATQERLVSLFRKMVGAGKKIVLSSSVPPEELPILASGLRAFDWGLFADIQPPEDGLRRRIESEKAARREREAAEESQEQVF